MFKNSFFIIWNWLSTRYFRNIPFSNFLSPLQSALQQHQHQQYLLSKYLQLFAKVLYFVTSWYKKLRDLDKFFGHVFTSFCSVVYDLIILAEERTFHSAPSVLWTTIPWEEIKSNLFEILFVAHKVFFCDFRQALLKIKLIRHISKKEMIFKFESLPWEYVSCYHGCFLGYCEVENLKKGESNKLNVIYFLSCIASVHIA